MKIKEIISSNGRNDFKALFVCPLCNHEYTAWGYSDGNFYNNVMPNAICPNCGTNEKGENESECINRLGRSYAI